MTLPNMVNLNNSDTSPVPLTAADLAPRPAWRRFLRRINPLRLFRLHTARAWLEWTEQDLYYFGRQPGTSDRWMLQTCMQAARLRAEIRELERI